MDKIKILAGMAKKWVLANKLISGIASSVVVVGVGTAVAIGSGAQLTDAIATEVVEIESETDYEEVETASVWSIPETVSESADEELEEEEEAEEEEEEEEEAEDEEEESETVTAEAVSIEVPAVVVAPVNDSEDTQPQTTSNKGTSKAVSISQVIEEAAEDETYENIAVSYGIDVSKWQGSIDWAQVAASGVEFAMIRVGYRGATNGEIVMDPYFEANIKGALANNIKVGIYFYSQAIDEEEARVEAAWVVSVISKYQITYPVAYDCEGLSENRMADVTKEQRSKNAAAFLSYIRSAGYTSMMYSGKWDYLNSWDLSYITGCKYWLAHYTSGGLSTPSDYTGSYDMWQYTSKGTVPGISTNVDLNIAYFSYSNTADPVVGTITYTVTDENGSPISGATVSMSGSASRKTTTATTNSSGVATFSNMVVDDYTVSVSGVPDGYVSVSGSSTSVSFGKATSSYSGSLKLSRGYSSGVGYYVVDQDGSPVAGATVTLSGTAKLGGTVSATAITDSNGLAQFTNILFGTYNVYVSDVPDGYSMSAATVSQTSSISSTSGYTGSNFVVNKDEEPEAEDTSESSSETNTSSSSVVSSSSLSETNSSSSSSETNSSSSLSETNSSS